MKRCLTALSENDEALKAFICPSSTIIIKFAFFTHTTKLNEKDTGIKFEVLG